MTTTTMPAATELPTFDRYRSDRPTSLDAPSSDVSASLLGALGRAIAGRTTRVAIRGASGTGRTQLIEQVRTAATRRSMRVLATHGRTVDTDVPYAALLTLLHPVADRLGELPAAERDSLLAAIDLRDADVAVRAARTGLWRLLTRLSEERPLLVAVDDSDQIDGATLDVMAFALGRMDSQAIALLVAVDGRRTDNPLEAIGDELVVLDGMDHEAVVAAVHDAVSATDWVARRMASFAGGNSTVAIQLVRSLSPDQRSGRVACPAVPTPPTELASALGPELDRMSAAARTAIAVVAADTTADIGVVRAAMRDIGLGDDPVAELERIDAVTVTGTTLRARTPMLGVVGYDRLSAAERRTIHHALAAHMTAPEHALARAWQLTGGSDGPNDQVAAAMSAVGTAAARHGNLRRAAIAHQRAADFAESGLTRATAAARALACWTAIGDPVPMRRLLAEGGNDDTTTHIARSAAVRWLDGDGTAVAELRRGAQRATDAERPLLDALFADAAMEAGRGRDALEVAARVAATQPTGAARDLAVALLVLGGRAAPADLGTLEPESGDVAHEVVRARAIVRRAQAHLRFGDARSAELELGATTDGGPLLWDPAERTALRGRLVAAQGHPVTARQLLVTAIDELPQGAVIPRAVLGNALAEVTFLLGDGEAAMELLDELVPTFHRHAMARREASAQTTIGRIAWSVGETDVAVACLERARRIDPFAPVGDLVALLTSLGRDEDAHAWLARVDHHAPGAPAPIDILRARANAATDATGFTTLAAALRAGQLVVPEAELMIDLAAWHHRRAHWSDLYPAAEQAARLLIPGGVKGWIARLDRLEPPAGQVSGDVPQALAPLTDAERRVALAVSRGLTNKEAAAELFVSVKTIDSHLQRIYPKLFVRSRGELAVLVNAAMNGASGVALGRPTGNPPDAGR